MDQQTPQRVRAAVMRAARGGLEVREVGLAPPAEGEVLVQMKAVGVCHSDLSVLDGTLPSKFPIVLGHEGAGVIASVGAHTEGPHVGQRVVLSWLAQCGHCFYCMHDQPALCEIAAQGMGNSSMPDGTTRFTLDGHPMAHMLGLGAFAEYCVVPSSAVHAIPDDVSFEVAALIGCGVLTGFGAAINSASIHRGDSVAVIGCGGVGLNAIQGAIVAGAATVIAVDPSPSRRDLAIRMGATDALHPENVSRILGLTKGRGVDVAIESAGREESVKTAVRITRRGGEAVLVGAAAPAVRLSVPVFSGLVTTEKSIRGSLYGSSDVARDIERVVGLYRSGDLLLDELVSGRFALDDVGEAFEYCARGEGARAVVLL